MILIGNCKVGKTSLLNFIVGRKGGGKEPTPTIGVEYAPVVLRVGSSDVRVNIWDTSGAEKYLSITRNYYRRSHGAIVIYDITDRRYALSNAVASRTCGCGWLRSRTRSETRCRR